MLELGPEHQAAVVETGMDALGQIRALGEMVRPDVAVITNVDDVHLEYFNSRDEILQAKAEIFENLRPGGLAVLSGGRRAAEHPPPRKTASSSAAACPRAATSA